jgi:hypothetical protein
MARSAERSARGSLRGAARWQMAGCIDWPVGHGGLSLGHLRVAGSRREPSPRAATSGRSRSFRGGFSPAGGGASSEEATKLAKMARFRPRTCGPTVVVPATIPRPDGSHGHYAARYRQWTAIAPFVGRHCAMARTVVFANRPTRDLVAQAQRALGMTHRAFGEALGASERTVQRWASRGGALTVNQLPRLAGRVSDGAGARAHRRRGRASAGGARGGKRSPLRPRVGPLTQRPGMLQGNELIAALGGAPAPNDDDDPFPRSPPNPFILAERGEGGEGIRRLRSLQVLVHLGRGQRFGFRLLSFA